MVPWLDLNDPTKPVVRQSYIDERIACIGCDKELTLGSSAFVDQDKSEKDGIRLIHGGPFVLCMNYTLQQTPPRGFLQATIEPYFKLGFPEYRDLGDDVLGQEYFNPNTLLSTFSLSFKYPLLYDCRGCTLNHEDPAHPHYRYCQVSPEISIGPGLSLEKLPIREFRCVGDSETGKIVTLRRFVAKV